MFTNSNLIKPMLEQISIIGNPIQAAGWYGHTDGLHTISIVVQNFTGRISVQAAITTVPVDADWFSVLPGDVAYIQYPQNGYVIQSPATGETSTYDFSFTINAVWVRAVVDRSYFLAPIATPQYVSTFGLVDHILMRFGNHLGENDYKWPVPDYNHLDPSA
jgi:hypothetical protein